jgi:hypothetical protein
MAQYIEIASAGSDGSDAEVLPDFTSSEVMVFVSNPGGGRGVRLPANSRIGDRVHFLRGSTKVYDESESYIGFDGPGFATKTQNGWIW